MIDTAAGNNEKATDFGVVGIIEGLDRRHVSGWAWQREAPDQPVEVEVVDDDAVIIRGIADQFRADLEAAGIGGGCHGFVLPIPSDANFSDLGQIIVRVVNSGKVLPRSPSIELRLIDQEVTQTDAVSNNGWLDLVAPHVVRGWVRCPNFGESVLVSVCTRNNALTEKTISRKESDDIESGLIPFEIDLPLHDASSAEELSVSVEIDSASVALYPVNVERREYWADFEIVDATYVIGWVAHDEQSAAPSVEVLVAGQPVWLGPARRLLNGHAIGFKVDIPLPENWDNPVEVAVRLPQYGTMIAAPKLVRPIERFIGNLESSRIIDDAIVVTGWIYNKARPFDRLDVKLYNGTTVLAESRAELFRKDLQDAGFGNGFCAFTLTCSYPSFNYDIQLTVAVGGAVVFRDIYIEAPEYPISEVMPGDTTIAPPLNLSSFHIDGAIDICNYSRCSGWARYREAPNTPVLLDLYINNSCYLCGFTGSFRGDVGAKFKDHGYHGFSFEIAPYIAQASDVKIEVAPRNGTSNLTKQEHVLRKRPNAKVLNQLPTIEPSRVAPVQALYQQRPLGNRCKIAYIILNLNGGALLDDLFRSFERHNRYRDYEILVIDHGSTDESEYLVESWTDRLHLRMVNRGKNYSFSSSNNFGASQTDAEILVFLNNDVVLSQDIGAEIVDLLCDESVGVVGVRLLDLQTSNRYSISPIQHLGVHFDWMHRQVLLKPFETRYAPHLQQVSNDLVDVPAVTGALMACRREEFLVCGGYDEGYFYGYEDVDLCLRYGLDLGKRILCANNIAAFHARAYSRSKGGPSMANHLADNSKRLEKKYGSIVRRRMAQERFSRPGFWTTVAPRIAFAVTSASDRTSAGDYFTALELAREIIKLLPCQVVFLEQRENWFDMAGIDVLITMRDDYDLRKLHNTAPHLLKIGWARNWIDRWAIRDWAQDYDVMWASSKKGAFHLTKKLARPVDVIPIATNLNWFQKGTFTPELASDYCFTGSYFNTPREILYQLDPAALPYEFALFGHGWSAFPHLAAFDRGPLPYSEMPNVYASTKIVIDDANSATQPWGSVNSRVFDALAAGALVITNGRDGAKETFNGLLPSYSSTQELEDLLWRYLNDDSARSTLVAALQKQIAQEHTYRRRAELVVTELQHIAEQQLRFAIKIGTPSEGVKEEWGDYHFALGIKRALTRRGHTVRIDYLNRWEGEHCLSDDVVVVLRGLSRYEPKAHQVNLMWNISHPDSVSKEEYELYDHVFVASNSYAKKLTKVLAAPVSALLQCTDSELFNPSLEPLAEAPEYLFVGNSRKIYRDVVKRCIELDVHLEIYGTHWEKFVPLSYIKGRNIPNSELGSFYKSAKVVLNDHWGDMKACGFISNRLFDAVAAGACVVTDYVAGLEEIFGDSVFVYSSNETLRHALKKANKRRSKAHLKKVATDMQNNHTFDQRVDVILDHAKQYLAISGTSR